MKVKTPVTCVTVIWGSRKLISEVYRKEITKSESPVEMENIGYALKDYGLMDAELQLMPGQMNSALKGSLS